MRYLVILSVAALFAGCNRTPAMPVEAAQAAFAACMPHEGLNTFTAYWRTDGELVVVAHCKTQVEVTVPLKARQARYDLMT